MLHGFTNLEIKADGLYQIGKTVGYRSYVERQTSYYKFEYLCQTVVKGWEGVRHDYYGNRELPLNKLLSERPHVVFRFICI